MPYGVLPLAVTGEIIPASYGNQIRDDFAETAPGKATTSGRIFYATGPNAIAENANIAVTAGGAMTTRNPSARVKRSVALSVANETDTVVACDAETYDNGSLHDNVTNNSRQTAPITGIYLVTSYVKWARAEDSGGARLRMVRLRVDGATTIAQQNARNHIDSAGNIGIGGVDISVSTVVSLTAGQYVETVVRQETGNPLNLDTIEFSMTHLGMQS